MNRTDRLYALVEELRAAAPRSRSARSLAERFAVSVRTVERDLSALQQAGLPIWAQPGRTGGYTIDPAATLGPMGFTADEALAVMIGLGSLTRGPFGAAAGTALRKVLAVMPDEDARRATALAARIHLLEPDEVDAAPVPPALAESLRADRVMVLQYRDKNGAVTRREVEPLGTIGKDGAWYLIAWCRLRDGVRAFRGDRMVSAELTDERPPRRALRREDLDIPFGTLRSIGDELG
ncbi:YafY family protein [Schumannella luteola]|uniref:Putative DNA-binding transcriptional regulator YafY n=1 Tax=Schumannella luteola TaxID=472059 RepID=A0A852YGE4_9MICO|nr:putative DNA-binding transcriptional regulator YafY [Schumannella luteola]TPX04039.1 WYL domain-containing protein [Schumannella luteola]